MNSQNLKWQQQGVIREMRELSNQHKSVVIWLTGLSGSGKSTVAQHLEKRLFGAACKTYVLDGDNIRHNLCNDLSFSDLDRKENIRRVGEVARLFVDAGTIVISAFISPFQQDRDIARKLFEPGDFIEVYCKASIKTCESRDVKGLYKKARSGDISNFTGISSTYEVPTNPEIVIDTKNTSVEFCTQQIIDFLNKRNIVSIL